MEPDESTNEFKILSPKLSRTFCYDTRLVCPHHVWPVIELPPYHEPNPPLYLTHHRKFARQRFFMMSILCSIIIIKDPHVPAQIVNNFPVRKPSWTTRSSLHFSQFPITTFFFFFLVDTSIHRIIKLGRYEQGHVEYPLGIHSLSRQNKVQSIVTATEGRKNSYFVVTTVLFPQE